MTKATNTAKTAPSKTKATAKKAAPKKAAPKTKTKAAPPKGIKKAAPKKDASTRARSNRDKGKRGERDVIKLLQPIVDNAYTEAGLAPVTLQRNTLQSDNGGFDIVGLEWLALEVKNQERLNIAQWWQQTVNQAKDEQEPVLLYKVSRSGWRVRMFGRLLTNDKRIRLPVDIAFDGFALFVAVRIAESLQRLEDAAKHHEQRQHNTMAHGND